MEEKDLIRIRWHVDRTVDPAMFMLVCTHPDYQDLLISPLFPYHLYYYQISRF